MCLIEGKFCKYWKWAHWRSTSVGKRSGNNARYSFPLQDKVSYVEETFFIWYLGSLFQKDDIYSVCTHSERQLEDLAFSLFKNRITVLLI